MFPVLPRILSRTNFILILVMSNLAATAPLKSRKRSSGETEREGFSAAPRILEIQLPLRIASREDLAAWSKYVMTLVASKMNLMPSILKNAPSVDSRSRETTGRTSAGEKRQGFNYPARRLKEPPVRSSGDEKVIAYPLPIGGMGLGVSQDPLDLPVTTGPNELQPYNGYYANFNVADPFRQINEADDVFGNPDILMQPPAATYLPLPLRTTDRIVAYRNISGYEEPAKLQTTKNALNLRVKTHNDEPGTRKNSSRVGEPLLTFPFEAVITITRPLPAATTVSKTQPKNYLAIRARDPSAEFPPYFEENFTLTNESGQVNVILDDLTAGRKKVKENARIEEDEEEGREDGEKEQDARGQRKKNEKKKRKKSAKQQKSNKRQSSVLGDLLRMLGILRKPTKNTTEISVAAPVLSILKGTNSQKVQVSFEEAVPNRGRRNETSQAQELDGNEDDDDDDDGDGNGNGGDDDRKQAQEEDDEEEGGSLQPILDLLPLAVPILEEFSDPESDVELTDVLAGAIPLLEGLSDPEQDGIDIPGALVPLSQRLSEGPEGEGSDSGAVLGPLIQLIAPLIGPILGPLIGPLSRTSSGPGGKEGSASLITSLITPLSEPGANGQSVLSGLIASITARLSKELAASAGDSDVKSLVSALVSGVLAGASAGSTAASNGHKGYKQDSYHAPTTYGAYGTYHHPPAPASPDSGDAVKQVLGAFLKLSATSSTSSANLSGTSSSSSTGLSAGSSESKEPAKPTYGPPPARPSPYAPSSYSPPPASPNSPYTTFKRQIKRQQIRKT